MSGTGKTQLAVRLLESAEQYTFRWWARASSRETLENDLAGIGAFLGISPRPAEPVADVAARVVQQLNETAGWLLVVDDAVDHASLSDLLPQSGGHVVTTTQNSGWYGYGDTVIVPMLNTEETKTILRTVPSAPGTDDSALDELVALTSGLALAVAQIASYMAATGSTVAEFAKLLREHRAALLARGDAGSHATLDATVGITLGKLSPAAVQLLQMLSVFAAVPLTLGRDHFSDAERHGDLANPVTFEDAIVELRSYSLIERSSGSVTTHELVQDVVSQRMSRGEFFGALLRALDIVDQQLPERTGLASSWPIVAHLLPHILSLLENLVSTPEFPVEASTLLLNRLSMYYSARGRRDEAERLLRQALELLNTSTSGDDSGTRGSLLNNLGNLEADRGALDAAEQTLREAIRQKEQGLGAENRLVGIAYAALATVVDALGRPSEAEELHSRALSIYRADGDDEHIADALSDLAQYALERGDLDNAHDLVAEAIDVASGVADSGAWPELCRSYPVLANVHELKEEYAEAVSSARKAFRVAAEAAPKSTQLASALATQGRFLGRMGEPKAGAALVQRAEAMYVELEGPTTLEGARIKGNLGRTLSMLGEHDEAIRLLRESEELISVLLPSSHPTVVTARFMLGHALLATSELRTGLQLLLEIANRSDDLPEIGAARALLDDADSFFRIFETMRSHGESTS
jgi:tetratricopeptide (TPR) repeat protein